MGWLWWQVIVGHGRARPLRVLVQLVAIAAGVALGYGIGLINTAALAEFTAAVREINGEPDASLVGSREGFDESLFAMAANHPLVTFASPVLETDVLVLEGPGDRAARLSILGIDALRAGALAPSLWPAPGESADGGEPDRFALFGDGLFLSPAALARFGVAVGERLTVQAGEGPVELVVTGTLPAARDGSVVGVMDLAFAQWRLDRLGRLTRIDLRLTAGATPADLARSLRLPAGVLVAGPDVAETRLSNLSRAYRVNLNVLALVALFTGAFLVFSLQSQALLARRSQLAFLRAAGVTARDLERLLLAEAALVGLLGSLLGLVAGTLLARAALNLLGGDLGGGFGPGGVPRLVLSPGIAAGYAALGILAAVAGSLLPARRVRQAPLAPALRPGAEEDDLLDLARPWPGLACLGIGAVLVWLPPVGGIPVAAYVAIGALLVGTIALQPRLASRLFQPFAAGLERARAGARRPLLLLAASRLAGAPGLASIAMAGIVASFALMVAMATMVTSFRGSVDDWLGRVLPADLYARVGQPGTQSHFSAADLERLRTHPDVLRVEFSRVVPLLLRADRAQVSLIVRPLDRTNPGSTLPLVGRPVAWQPGQPPPVWVSEAMVELYGARPGGLLELPLAGTSRPFFVAGVWRDYARQFGSVVLADSDYESLTGDTTRTDAALWLRPGVAPGALGEHLRGTLDAGAATEFSEPGALRALSLRIFDRSFAVTYLLEVAAIIIGLVAIAATFAAQAIARTREFGLLRHLGLTRREVLGLLALEGLLATASAVVAGLAAGLLVALILVHVVNPQSFQWTMDFRPPGPLLALLIAALLGCAALTAAAAGRRAVAVDALRAVHADG